MKVYNKNMKPMKIEIVTDGGPWAIHNMPCSQCGINKAVLEMWDETFQPCWECQKKGYATKKMPKWVKRLLDKVNR